MTAPELPEGVVAKLDAYGEAEWEAGFRRSDTSTAVAKAARTALVNAILAALPGPAVEPVLTVGAALGTAEAQSIRAVAEHETMHGEWVQQRASLEHRFFTAGRWGAWKSGLLSSSSLARRCRLVPIAAADEPPDARGPMPGGEG